MLIQYFKKVFREELFKPRIIGLFTNPFYFARRGLYHNISTFSPFIKGKVLDVGCGQKPYRKLFHVSDYIGLEVDSPQNRFSKQADYFYDGKNFPFLEAEFDSVIMNQVLEHVFEPQILFSEIRRVLKHGGIFLISVPFVWDEHEQPHDYARYSSFGLRYMLNKHGFEILEHRKSINDIRVIFQLLNGYIYKKLFSSNKYLNLFLTIIIISPLNLLGEFLATFLPKNDDLYLDNVILAVKKDL